MAQVRISVTSDAGDIDVTESSALRRFAESENATISKLLQQAIGKVDRAYGLSQAPSVEMPKQAEADA